MNHDCHYWKMLTEDTGSVSILPDGKVKEMAIDPNREIPELCDLSFKRCPYCGDPLDFNHKSIVKIELDTLHYGEKRLKEFVEFLEIGYRYKKLDELRTKSGVWIVLFEVEEDGDKIAIQLQNYSEVKMAYDKRHERIVLN